MLVRQSRLITAAAAGMMLTGAVWAQQQQPAGTGQQPSQQPAQTPPGTEQQRRSGADWPMDDKKDKAITDRDTAIRDITGANSFEDQLRTIAQNPAEAGDKLFVLCASKENAMEIAVARRAMQKTQNQEVKQLAQKIITDHEKAQQELSTVAQQVGVQPITQVPMGKQQLTDVLFSLPEDEFNKQYLSHLKACHAAAISKYGDAAVLAKNAAVKDYASNTLALLRDHRQQTATAARAVGLPAVAETDTGVIGERR